MTHWADAAAQELLATKGAGPHLFATAITPSGPIHVGNMREVLTTEAIFRATKDLDHPATLIYIADDYDPLRKVYPFLEVNEAGVNYEEFVGRPLREVPCPCGKHVNYSAHFLGPFLDNLKALGISPVVYSAYDMYHEGQYAQSTLTFFRHQELVREIIEKVSGRQLPKNWAPFNPQCDKCRTLKDVVITSYAEPNLEYKCPCGHEGIVDVSKGGGGKLPWRLDWPARWQFLGVTFEAFGKDHGASGGSWDSGIRLIREVLGGVEPHHVMYEFLNLKGVGAMHSSTGLAISAEDVLHMTPPEVLRYLLMRQSPRKHIDFDPGQGILNLVDEFDRLERIVFGKEENPGTFTEVERTYQLSCPGDPPATAPANVPYRHLVTISQMADNLDEVRAILARANEEVLDLDADDLARLEQRVDHVRYWLNRFAPDQVKFKVQAKLPDGFTPGEEGTKLLQALVPRLEAIEWVGKEIHDAVYESLEATGQKPGTAFKVLYEAFLNQERGPRAGFLLASMEKSWAIARLQSALAS